MAELLIRFNGNDSALLNRIVTARQTTPVGLDRVVIDAQTAMKPDFSEAARRAGLPLLIDPSTFYLQDVQHPGDAWAALPFATWHALSVADLLSPQRQERLVAECVEFQMSHGATVVIAPYVHVERENDGWVDVQVGLLRRTRRYLDIHQIALPVIPVLAISWSLAHRPRWPLALDPLLDAVEALRPTEVALAVSKIDQGARPEDRLADLYAVLRRIRQRHPVLMWNQGTLGEACVAAGAAGYETGIGWQERCDLRTRMSSKRRAPTGNFGARPVYLHVLGRSMPKRTVTALLEDPVVSPRLICSDPACCPTGKQALRGDSRAHTVNTRARRLRELTAMHHPRWAWAYLEDAAQEGLVVAGRINTLATHGSNGITRADLGALRAIAITAEKRRRTARRYRAA